MLLQKLLPILAILTAVIPTAVADEKHKGDEYVDVEIKAAAGIGYVLHIKVDDETKADNPKPRHDIKSRDVCTENYNNHAMICRCMKWESEDAIKLSLGEWVSLKLRKGRKIGLDAATGCRFTFEITKAGKIDCLGQTGNPYCKYV